MPSLFYDTGNDRCGAAAALLRAQRMRELDSLTPATGVPHSGSKSSRREAFQSSCQHQLLEGANGENHTGVPVRGSNMLCVKIKPSHRPPFHHHPRMTPKSRALATSFLVMHNFASWLQPAPRFWNGSLHCMSGGGSVNEPG